MQNILYFSFTLLLLLKLLSIDFRTTFQLFDHSQRAQVILSNNIVRCDFQNMKPSHENSFCIPFTKMSFVRETLYDDIFIISNIFYFKTCSFFWEFSISGSELRKELYTRTKFTECMNISILRLYCIGYTNVGRVTSYFEEFQCNIS